MGEMRVKAGADWRMISRIQKQKFKVLHLTIESSVTGRSSSRARQVLKPEGARLVWSWVQAHMILVTKHHSSRDLFAVRPRSLCSPQS